MERRTSDIEVIEKGDKAYAGLFWDATRVHSAGRPHREYQDIDPSGVIIVGKRFRLFGCCWNKTPT